MKRSKYLFLIIAVFASMLSFASESPRWVQGTLISKVSVQPNGNIYITLDRVVPNLGCRHFNQWLLQLDTAAPNFDQQYSLILASFMAEKRMDIYVSGCGDAYAYAQNTNVLN